MARRPYSVRRDSLNGTPSSPGESYEREPTQAIRYDPTHELAATQVHARTGDDGVAAAADLRDRPRSSPDDGADLGGIEPAIPVGGTTGGARGRRGHPRWLPH